MLWADVPESWMTAMVLPFGAFALAPAAFRPAARADAVCAAVPT